MVFVSVKIERHQDASAVAFRETVAMLPYVISRHLVSGEADLFLQVVVPDLAAYERLLVDRLAKLPSVSDIRSNFTIQTGKSEGPLPLSHPPGT